FQGCGVHGLRYVLRPSFLSPLFREAKKQEYKSRDIRVPRVRLRLRRARRLREEQSSLLLQALPDRFHPRLRRDCLRRKADQWAFVTPASYDFNNFACSAAKANPVR